jgi:diguanylate cyclase (GGDEF)-like protein/PAS domain S-box-containing protein
MPIDIEKDSTQTALAKLKAREDILRKLEEISKLGSWEVNLKTGMSVWSDQSYKIYGLDKESTTTTMDLFLSHVVPEDLPKVKSFIEIGIKTAKLTSFECKIKRKDGKILDLLINGQVILDEDNKPDKIIGTTQDITEFTSLKKHSDELSMLIESSSNEIYVVDYRTLKYLYVNQGVLDSLGYTMEEMLNKTIYDINPNITKKDVLSFKKELNSSKKILNRSTHIRKDGSTYTVQAYIHPIVYDGVQAYVIFDTDITELIEIEERLKEESKKLAHLAHHDTLTNLPNRTLFRDRLSQTILSSQRHNSQFALLFIDLDQFKKINDSLGHHIGDLILIEASKRLRESIRDEDTLARLGGDEFTIILKDIQNVNDVSHIASKIVENMKKEITVEDRTLFISSSIGISLYPQDTTDDHDLIKFADTAMYKAKEEGRDNFQYYSKDLTKHAFENVIMETSLRIAIKEKQFVVYYQPQIDPVEKSIVGMEALVRWMHPQIGLISPIKFIPLAEENGLILDIDNLVMKDAMREFVRWYKAGLNPGKLALNLAMKQLAKKSYIEDLLQTMKEMNFKPQWLALEVTEGQIMNNPHSSIEKLNAISQLGIELAIDDFGTGYSSLSYLKKLPLDKLKIDQSFVRDITTDEDDASITKAIIALGKNLNMKLIAEGVETEEQRDFLVENGCDYIQGYLYAKPMPANEIEEMLKANEI